MDIKNKDYVGADSLMCSAPTYSGVALQKSRVGIPAWGPSLKKHLNNYFNYYRWMYASPIYDYILKEKIDIIN